MLKRERISKMVGADGRSARVPLGQNPFFHEYFRLWNEQRYYDAHDVLEQLWLDDYYARHASLMKGMIQAAGAFVHLQKNFEHPTHAKHSRRLRPAVKLFELAEKNLSKFGPRHHALDVLALVDLLRATRGKITDSGLKVNPWSPKNAPKVELSSRKN